MCSFRHHNEAFNFQKKATRVMTRGLQNMTQEEKVERQVFDAKKKKQKNPKVVVLKFINGIFKEEGNKLFKSTETRKIVKI